MDKRELKGRRHVRIFIWDMGRKRFSPGRESSGRWLLRPLHSGLQHHRRYLVTPPQNHGEPPVWRCASVIKREHQTERHEPFYIQKCYSVCICRKVLLMVFDCKCGAMSLAINRNLTAAASVVYLLQGWTRHPLPLDANLNLSEALLK